MDSLAHRVRPIRLRSGANRFEPCANGEGGRRLEAGSVIGARIGRGAVIVNSRTYFPRLAQSRRRGRRSVAVGRRIVMLVSARFPEMPHAAVSARPCRAVGCAGQLPAVAQVAPCRPQTAGAVAGQRRHLHPDVGDAVGVPGVDLVVERALTRVAQVRLEAQVPPVRREKAAVVEPARPADVVAQHDQHREVTQSRTSARVAAKGNGHAVFSKGRLRAKPQRQNRTQPREFPCCCVHDPFLRNRHDANTPNDTLWAR